MLRRDAPRTPHPTHKAPTTHGPTTTNCHLGLFLQGVERRLAELWGVGFRIWGVGIRSASSLEFVFGVSGIASPRPCGIWVGLGCRFGGLGFRVRV